MTPHVQKNVTHVYIRTYFKENLTSVARRGTIQGTSGVWYHRIYSTVGCDGINPVLYKIKYNTGDVYYTVYPTLGAEQSAPCNVCFCGYKEYSV